MTRYRVWRIRINLIAMSTTGEEASIMAGITNMYRKEDYGGWGWRSKGYRTIATALVLIILGVAI